MDATTTPKIKFSSFLQQLKSDYPSIKFKKSNTTYWNPNNKTVYYNDTTQFAVWSVLHEVGHALLDHKNYGYDVKLVQLERDAWSKAKDLSKRYDISISNEHIEDCLDSYRDWLHKRSICPGCENNGMQSDDLTYRCLNCAKKWTVTHSKFCRVYRSNLKDA